MASASAWPLEHSCALGATIADFAIGGFGPFGDFSAEETVTESEEYHPMAMRIFHGWHQSARAVDVGSFYAAAPSGPVAAGAEQEAGRWHWGPAGSHGGRDAAQFAGWALWGFQLAMHLGLAAGALGP